MMVDADGNPIDPAAIQPFPEGQPVDQTAPAAQAPRGEERLDQDWLDRAVGREPAQRETQPAIRRPPATPPQSPQQQRQSAPPANPVERRPVPSQP
jgi:hypothetical protein